MHLPYPARKDSNPPRYLPARASRYRLPPRLLRIRLKGGIVIALVVLSFFYIVSSLRSRSRSSSSSSRGPYAEHVPSGRPAAVIVTVLNDQAYSKGYLDVVKENRRLYAEKHGYETFFPQTTDYPLEDDSPDSWTKVVAMRHAITKFPDAGFFWFLDQDAFIMDPKFTVEGSLMEPKSLESVMIVDHPVVPPDSIIRTFGHLKGTDVHLVLTQDKEGLSVGSFVVRNSDWAHFFLETWFDPIYRSYNFQKAESHALEHIVQWHPTILSKLALVPQRLINSYSTRDLGEPYQAGDVAVRFPSCGKADPNTCETESRKFMQQWRNAFNES